MSDDAPEFAWQLEFLTDPWGAFKRRGKVIAFTFLIAVAALLAAVQFVIREEFLAEARVLVSTPRFSEDFVPSVEAGSPLERLNALVGEILARDELESLVETYDLYPESGELASSGDLLERMRRDISVFTDPASVVSLRPNQDEASRVFIVSFAYRDAALAASVANAVATSFVDAAIKLQTEQARIAADFLRRELEKTEAELEARNQEIAELKVESRGVLPEELDSTLGRLDRLQSQRQSLALQVAQTETNLVTLAQQGGGSDLPSPQVQLDLLRARLAEQRAVYTDDHPNVISLERQVAVLESELASGAVLPGSKQALVEGAQRTLSELQSQLASAEAEIKLLESRVEGTPEIARQLAAMERKADALRQKHDDFLEKVNDAELALSVESAQQGRRITILERAFAPASPLRPRARFQAVAVAAAAGLALALGFLLEFLDPVVISGRQVEQRFSVPVIGATPPIS